MKLSKQLESKIKQNELNFIDIDTSSCKIIF